MNNPKLSHLTWRAAIKMYDSSKKLTSEQVELLVDAARYAPTSYGVQPFKLYVVSDDEKKKALRTAGYDQPQFTDASHIFVFAARLTVTEEDVNAYVSRIASQRGVEKEQVEDFRQVMLGSMEGRTPEQLHHWAARQAYLSLGLTLDVAASNNIDTTPMEGFNAQGIDDALGITDEGYTAVVVMAAGYRSDKDTYAKMPKVRKTAKEFVATD